MKQKLNTQKPMLVNLNAMEMGQIVGGSNCQGLSLACGAGIALSVFTGGIGAIMFGPSTGALCYAAYRC